MIYQNHNLRTSLQEWKNRLSKASESEFSHQLRYFVTNIEDEKLIRGILNEACSHFNFAEADLSKKIDSWPDYLFSTIEENAAFSYQALKHLIGEFGYVEFKDLDTWSEKGFDWEDRRPRLLAMVITPMVQYVHDKLDRSSSVIFLLEKYKRRTEWFTKGKMLTEYRNLTQNYEQLLEDDLRLFLFDQGIDYPFSTPKSASGRADIVGELEASDPLIVEIKIVDSEKSYGKGRIREGFTQTVKYSNDYNKNVGFLVIFNFDDVEIDFGSFDSSKVFPARLQFGNKNYYFIVINMFVGESASKAGKIKRMEILETDLIG